MENFLNVSAPQDLVLKLYTSNTMPHDALVVGDLTEASGGGYSDVGLVSSNWVVTPGNPTLAAYPEISCSFTGEASNVFGYYVVQSVSGALLWAERFADAPLNIQNDGDEILVTLKITLE
jgi:hypothetical protein